MESASDSGAGETGGASANGDKAGNNYGRASGGAADGAGQQKGSDAVGGGGASKASGFRGSGRKGDGSEGGSKGAGAENVAYRWHVDSLLSGIKDMDLVPLMEEGIGEREMAGFICVLSLGVSGVCADLQRQGRFLACMLSFGGARGLMGERGMRGHERTSHPSENLDCSNGLPTTSESQYLSRLPSSLALRCATRCSHTDIHMRPSFLEGSEARVHQINACVCSVAIILRYLVSS